jgi:hypothetical protein
MHPKILALSWAAMGLHAWSISYCDAALSDGFVPLHAWPAKAGADRAVQALVAAGLWCPVPGGYQLHDYTDYNRSKAEVDAYMAAKIAAGQAGGRASAQARAQAHGRGGAQANVKQDLKQNPTPVPGSTSLAGFKTPAGGPGMAGPISPETIPESGDYPRARAREDDPLGVLNQPSIHRKFDRQDGQPSQPASPSKISQKTEHESAVC